MSLITPRRVLALVCLGFVALTALVAFKTPPWESNDEPDHAQNVETLRSGRWYRITLHSGLESHQPPLYYLGLAGWADVVGLPHNPTRPVSKRTATDVRNNPGGVFLHHVPQNATDTGYVRRLRIPNIALGLATVLLTYAVARLVSRDRWTPVVAAAVAAFIPKFVFLSGTVNNDNLANTLGALAILASVYVVARRPGRPVLWAAGLGAILGLLTLTKLSALPLGIGLLLAVVYLAGRARLLASLGAFAGAAFTVCGWWLVRNVAWYGDPFASRASHDHFAQVAPAITITAGFSFHEAFVTLPVALWHSFWYSSGSNLLRWSTWWYLPFWALFAVGVVGLFWARSQDRQVLSVLGVFALGGFASYWIVGFEVNGGEGRVAFVAIAAIATLLALGFERLLIPVWARFALPTIGLIGAGIAIYTDVFRLYA